MESIKSPSGDYLLQAGIQELHPESMEWASSLKFWKVELLFFQKLLDKSITKVKTEEEKKKVEHLQNKLTYYSGELLDEFMHDVKLHEEYLSDIMKGKKKHDDETYRQQHLRYREQLRSFAKEFRSFKQELYQFIETTM